MGPHELGPRRECRHAPVGRPPGRAARGARRDGVLRQRRPRSRGHERAVRGPARGLPRRDLHRPHERAADAEPRGEHGWRPHLAQARRQPGPRHRHEGLPRPQGLLARAHPPVGHGGGPLHGEEDPLLRFPGPPALGGPLGLRPGGRDGGTVGVPGPLRAARRRPARRDALGPGCGRGKRGSGGRLRGAVLRRRLRRDALPRRLGPGRPHALGGPRRRLLRVPVLLGRARP